MVNRARCRHEFKYKIFSSFSVLSILKLILVIFPLTVTTAASAIITIASDSVFRCVSLTDGPAEQESLDYSGSAGNALALHASHSNFSAKAGVEKYSGYIAGFHHISINKST